MKIRQYFPNQKTLNRIVLKSILGVLIGIAAFTGFALIYITILFFVIPQNTQDHFSDLPSMLWDVVTVTTSWSLLFATAPAILFGMLLTFFIYQDFRKGKSSKRKAIITGIKIVGLCGLLISLFVAFTVFRPGDIISVLPYTIPVTLIAGLVGAWGGLQVYKEIFNFQENKA